MSRNAHPPTRPTVPRLHSALPPPARELLDAAAAVAGALGVGLWAAGGALRDLAAGAAPGDLDLACEGDAAALAAATAERIGADWRAEPRFATASVERGGRRLDIAALREERYPRPGALPLVRPGATIEADLRRRDFSVNAIALAVAGPRRGELLDPFGGLDDLAARRLRVLHSHGFRDDPTRLWRGARCAAARGLRPEPETARLIADAPRWIARVSGRRLLAEFGRIAAARRAAAAVRLLGGWGALRGAHPGWALAPGTARALARRPGPHPAPLLLAVLLAPLSERGAIAARLAAPRSVRRAAEDAARLLAARGRGPGALAALEGADAHARRAALWLDPERQAPLQRALRRWERTRPPLDARALRRLGVAPGPGLGAWLARLRRARYSGEARGAADARRLVREGGGPWATPAGTEDR